MSEVNDTSAGGLNGQDVPEEPVVVEDDEEEELDDDEDAIAVDDDEEEIGDGEAEEAEVDPEDDSSASSAAPTPKHVNAPSTSTASAPAATASTSAAAAAPLTRANAKMSYPIEDYVHPSTDSTHDLRQTYDWNILIGETDFVAAPVQNFKHAPMCRHWDHIIVGMKVEVENKEGDTFQYPELKGRSFWVASILRISGYYVLLRFEGFGQDGSKDFWMNITSDKIHPVGWCITKGETLVPHKAIVGKKDDWREFLSKRLNGARTIPLKFYERLWQHIRSVFKPGMKLEVVDKVRICQVRVATIQTITGKRLFLQYDDVDHDDKGFWCHEASPLIHHVGWARRVGHQIVASQAYYDRCALGEFEETDCTSDMFPEYINTPTPFLTGMKIEAVDPLNLASVCVATIMKVLRFGYIMVRIDGCGPDETGSDWFCYHGSSPLIFPPGFCEKNKIKLKPPSNYEENFSWAEYLKDTNSTAAPVNLFAPRDETKHGFKVGMKLEAADQMDPRLICVSTISRTVGRLLKVHFDGWEDDYDQWMDCESVDIYPVGWAGLVGHKLEGPRLSAPQKKEKKKPVGRKGKKRASNGAAMATPAPAAQGTSSASTDSPPKTKKTASPPPSTSATTPTPPPTSEAASSSSTPPPPAALTQAPQTLSVESCKTPPPPVLEPQASAAPSTPTTATAALPPSPSIKVIPRLIDSAGHGGGPAGAGGQRGRDMGLDPASWTAEEVAQFLEINECATLAEAFTAKGVDGSRFLSLTKAEIMKLVNNKIGPCLKVENLLSLLKARMNPAQARFLATINRKT